MSMENAVMEAVAHDETLPEIVAQFLFIMILSGIMFAIGFVFRPKSEKKRIKIAERDGEAGWQ